MKTVYQYRFETGDNGTFSILVAPDISFSCFMAEPPWKNNQKSISCIPDGEYVVKKRASQKYGFTYHITDVKGRSYILQHSGNYSGDASKGLKTHTLGCQLFGKNIGYLSGQKCVLNSRITKFEFERKMNFEDYKLIIKWVSKH